MNGSIARALALGVAAALTGCQSARDEQSPRPAPTSKSPAESKGPAASAVRISRADPAPLAADRPVGDLELVATFPDAMPTGVTVARGGRIFVNFPRWGDDVPFTVAEVKEGRPVAFPSAEINRLDPSRPAGTLISVQSVVVDPKNRLWLLDTGSVHFGRVRPGGAKLVCVDLATNQVTKTITFMADVALPNSSLSDVRFDLRRGPQGTAYITDSSAQGPNGIVVVDLASGESRRRLNDHPSTKAEPRFLPFVEGRELRKHPEGQPAQYIAIGSRGIAIGADGRRLFYCPLAGRRLFSVDADALADESATDEQVAATVRDEGMKPASEGLESDAQGRIYASAYELGAVVRRASDGRFETLVHDARVLWPDTLCLADDGYLYFTANQRHRQKEYAGGRDERVKPYALFRVKTDGTPLRLP